MRPRVPIIASLDVELLGVQIRDLEAVTAARPREVVHRSTPLLFAVAVRSKAQASKRRSCQCISESEQRTL